MQLYLHNANTTILRIQNILYISAKLCIYVYILHEYKMHLLIYIFIKYICTHTHTFDKYMIRYILQCSLHSHSVFCQFARTCAHSVVSMGCSPPGPPSLGFPRQEHWSGLPFPPGDLSAPGMEAASTVSPALAGGFIPT